jgi:hypothetical protein
MLSVDTTYVVLTIITSNPILVAAKARFTSSNSVIVNAVAFATVRHYWPHS